MKLYTRIENILKDKKKVFNISLGVIVLVVAAVILGGNRRPPVVAPLQSPAVVAVPAVPVPVVVPSTIAVDFVEVPLSDVVPFLVDVTGYSFVYAGVESQPVTWSEKGMNKYSVMTGFRKVVEASGLVVKEISPGSFVLSEKPPVRSPVRLDFGKTSKGIFFICGDKVLTKDQFPHRSYFLAGQWWADLTESEAAQLRPVSRPAGFAGAAVARRISQPVN